MQNNEGGVWPSGGRQQIPAAISSRGHRDYVITHNLDLIMDMESSSYSFPLQRKPRLENGTLVCPQVVSSQSRTLLLLLVGTTRLGAKNTFGKENLEAFIEYYYFMGKLP